ncbi:MAG: hypothetical protein NT167_32245, partial [Verrucomicrobia bacterium]|nr:hypothetical protein [Verrucomicrobiota bacterium]
MKDTHDHHCLPSRLVEDKIVPEARNWPGPDPNKLAEAALGADVGALGNELEGFFRCVQQPVSRREVVPRDI